MNNYQSYLGKVISDRYTLVSIIGEGESSVVFGAVDRQSGRTVALKMLAPDRHADEAAVARFVSEANLLALFNHPSIVKLLDASLESDPKYFVMEYIEGITLKKHIQNRGPLPRGEILFLSKQILSALGEVHKKGIVHSDIKPQNIVLLGNGNIKLMDFGISKEQENQNMNEDTAEVALGTVQYVSPEQAEGRPLTHLSDIYSFGVMLYEMATGVLPFSDREPGRVAAMHVSSTPIPPSRICKSVDGVIEDVILRAMEKLPEARPESASAILSAMEAAKKTKENEPRKPSFVLPPHRFGDMWRRLHLPSIFVGVLCALLLSVIVGLSVLAAGLSAREKNQSHIKIPSLVGLSYPFTGDTVPHPDIYRITLEYVNDPQNAGKILLQYPQADKTVKLKNGTCDITLTVALSPLPSDMPNFCGLTRDEAYALLAGFDCRVIESEISHPYLPSGRVARTEPSAGEPTGDTVTLYIVK